MAKTHAIPPGGGHAYQPYRRAVRVALSALSFLKIDNMDSGIIGNIRADRIKRKGLPRPPLMALAYGNSAVLFFEIYKTGP
jgi:hypothetical protein